MCTEPLQTELIQYRNETRISQHVSTHFGVRSNLSSLMPALSSVRHLNISDNDLGDQGLIQLEYILKNHPTLRELVLDRNFDKRTNLRLKAMESLAGKYLNIWY